MGVPQFFSFLMRRYGTGGIRKGRIHQSQSINQTEIPGRVSSLAFDMNSFFYKAAAIVYAEYEEVDPRTGQRRVMSDYKKRKRREYLKKYEKDNPGKLRKELFNTILTEIKTVIMAVRPQDTVIFAVDGMAPMAKIQQQRQRRYKSAKEKKGAFFDTNAFSPGTELMMELDAFLRESIKVEIQATKRGEGLWLPPKVIYSSHLVPGEGEHKIMEYYRLGIPEGPIAAQGGAHVIHGLDSDLIMLSMLMPQENVFLMREDLKDILHVQNLRLAVKNDLGTETAIDDFLVIMYLIGNDFLPRIKSLSDIFNSLDQCIDMYKRVGKPLTTNNGMDIHWYGLTHYLNGLKRLEESFVQDLAVSNGSLESPSKVIATATKYGRVSFSDFRNNWYNYALKVPIYSENLADKFDIPTNLRNPSRYQIQDMGLQFLTGMAWTSLYYRRGMPSINREWSYRYFYAPLIRDLYAVVARVAKSKLEISEYKVFSGMIEYNVVHQLLCIIPPASSELVPKEVQPLYHPLSPIVDQFPETFRLDRDGKAQEWMMHALVPHANIERIYDVMEAVIETISSRTIRKYEPDPDYMYPKKGFDPRNTVMQIRRTEDQIIQKVKPGIGKWGRAEELKRSTTERERRFNEASKTTVDINRDEFRIKPKPKIVSLDPNLRPLSERSEWGIVRQVRFNPRRRVNYVKPDKTRKSKKTTVTEVIQKLDFDPKEFALGL